MNRLFALSPLLITLFSVTLGTHPPLQIPLAPSTKSHLHSPPPFKTGEIEPFYNLNDTYTPSKYVLELSPYLDEEDGPLQFTTPGKVAVTFNVTMVTRQIILHVNPELLTVTENSINVTDLTANTTVKPVSITYSGDDRHYLWLNMANDLVLGRSYEIYAEFVAKINTQSLDGLYLSNYTNSAGLLKRVATTQMQAYHARQLFPCFDEPGLRAVFELSIIHKSNYTTVLGNSDVRENVSMGNSFTKTTFNPTVPMATYLFAMLVSDFDHVQAEETLFKVPVRTYAPPPVIARSGGDYSADIAAKMLCYFDDYFATDYPMMKMDSVHVPHFSAGAMENWGLNIYREAYLIYYPDESLESYKNLLTSVVSHELAHQNFGNLVTCDTWQELWLNEGFATYLSYLGVDGVTPEFNHREFILNDAFQYSMRVDVSSGSHPIVNDALTPDEIDSYFTGITYEKAGSINRMTENFLTESTYQKGLQLYLQAMSGQSVVSEDLFRYLDIAAAADNRLPGNLTVDTILKSWTLQKSHPLVRVSVGSENSVYISQERYADPEEVDLWYVPITLVTDTVLENNVPAVWLDGVAMTTVQHDTSKFIMINNNATGYYRVLYDTHLTSLIEKQLAENHAHIQPLSRSQLLDDYFNLAWMGHVSMETVLGLTRYLEKEVHFTVWEVVLTQLRTAYNFAEPTEFEALKSYISPKISAALSTIGVEQSPRHIGSEGILRSKLMDWACALQDENCVQYAHQFHDLWLQEGVAPSVDIQAAITCTIVATLGQPGFDFVWNKYREIIPSNASKLRFLNALACSQDLATLQELLDRSLTHPTIEEGHRVVLVQRIALNSMGRNLVISFLRSNLDRIIVAMGGVEGVGRILSTLAGVVANQEKLDEVLKFITDNSLKLAPLPTNNYLNNIRNNMNWKVNFGNGIYGWMKDETTPEQGGSNASADTRVLHSVSLISIVAIILAY